MQRLQKKFATQRFPKSIKPIFLSRHKQFQLVNRFLAVAENDDHFKKFFLGKNPNHIGHFTTLFQIDQNKLFDRDIQEALIATHKILRLRAKKDGCDYVPVLSEE
jgi:hypothetical protein